MRMHYLAITRFIFLSALFISPLLLLGQEGQHISVSGIGQLTKLNNRDDYNARSNVIQPNEAITRAFSLRYTNNWEKKFGFETGVIYSRIGQNYEGEIDSTFSGYVDVTDYESQIQMDYLKVPILFRFNSTLDAGEVTYLSIGIGFSMDILLDVQSSTSPDPVSSSDFPDDLSIHYRDLYENVSGSFMADAIFNFKLSEQWFLKSGININFGISDIEEKGIKLPNDAPSTWHFPLSTHKEKPPDTEARKRTRHTIFGLEIGVAYRFNKGQE